MDEDQMEYYDKQEQILAIRYNAIELICDYCGRLYGYEFPSRRIAQLYKHANLCEFSGRS